MRIGYLYLIEGNDIEIIEYIKTLGINKKEFTKKDFEGNTTYQKDLTHNKQIANIIHMLLKDNDVLKVKQ
jgi:hypothetical protein